MSSYVKPFYSGEVQEMIEKIFPIENPIYNKIYKLPNKNIGWMNRSRCVHLLSVIKAIFMNEKVYILQDMKIHKNGKLSVYADLGIFKTKDDVKQKIDSMMQEE